MAATDAETFSRLLSRLDPKQSDDVSVVSLVAHRSGDGQWSLLYGSVLLGPPGMAASSWLEWREASGDAGPRQVSMLLQRRGITLSLFANFTAVDGDWLIARTPLSGTDGAIDQVGRWITELTGGGSAIHRVDGSTEPVTAALESADALAMSSPWLPSELQPLVFAARRPVLGYRFPLAASGEPMLEPPASWPTETGVIGQPLFTLLGLSVTSNGALPTPSLAIGRLRRTAWFSDVRLTEYIKVVVTLGSQQASPADLEVDLEEYAKDGLVHARRLRLADVAIPEGPQDRIDVVLPTLGPELHRRLRLYDLAGRLLDT